MFNLSSSTSFSPAWKIEENANFENSFYVAQNGKLKNRFCAKNLNIHHKFQFSTKKFTTLNN